MEESVGGEMRMRMRRWTDERADACDKRLWRGEAVSVRMTDGPTDRYEERGGGGGGGEGKRAADIPAVVELKWRGWVSE